jgi:hypothetical protein
MLIHSCNRESFKLSFLPDEHLSPYGNTCARWAASFFSSTDQCIVRCGAVELASFGAEL